MKRNRGRRGFVRSLLSTKASRRRSGNHSAGHSSALERIEHLECRTLLSATPTLTVTDASGTFTGRPFVATVSATVNNTPIPIGQSLNFSTYLGSNSTSRAINVATDNFGNTFVTGWTTGTNFPTTSGAYETTGAVDGSRSAFVAKFDANGNLLWSTLIDGAAGFAIAVDSSDNVYVGGEANATDFTTTAGAFQTTASTGNAFVAKLNPSGSALIWATYLGGSSFGEADALAVDAAGNVYVAGDTTATDFPTLNALQPINRGGSDGFVSELNNTGSALVFSTYGGGSGDDFPSAIALDAAGNIYFDGTTSSPDFPTTPGAIQTTYGGGASDAFVAKLGPGGTSLIYSTYLGGSGDVTSSDVGMAVDAQGDAYVTGTTDADTIPMVNAYQSTFSGQSAYIAEVNPSGTALVNSTYFGTGTNGSSLAMDSAGNVYIAGQVPPGGIPTVDPANTSGNSYVAEFNLSTATLVYSTYLGATDDSSIINPVGVTSNGNIILTGDSTSASFPTLNAYQSTLTGSRDAFVTGLQPELTVSYYAGSTATGTPLSGAPSAAGTYTVVATFTSTDPNYTNAQSDPVTFTISPGAPVTPTVTAFDPSGVYDGSPFTATATAQGTEGEPASGTFAFTYYVGTSDTGTGTSTPPVDAGTDTVVASFTSSDPDFTDAQSAPVTFTISPTTPRTSVSASAGTVNLGESETLTATVTSAVATPNGGTVTFFDGTTTLGTAPLTNGTASLTTTTLAAGLDVVSASYSGDGLDFTGSTSALSPASIIQTVAGTGVEGSNPGGIPATSANLFYPYSIAVDGAGDLFIAEELNHIVQEVNAKTGLITTVAGTGTAGYNGDGIAATSAELNFPTGVALDAAGDIFITDAGNNRIREVNATTGLISTIAGTGVAGDNGDGIAATSAELNVPLNITFDSAGNLYIADWGNNLVREVNATTGLISTIAGTGTAGYNGDGIAAASAELNGPDSIAVDAAGDVYIAESGDSRVREVSAATGLINTVVGIGSFGYNGDGIAATSAQLAEPEGIALDAAGNLYIADTGNSRIRVVDAGTGLISTVAGIEFAGYNGDGAPAGSSQLNQAVGVAFDTAGDLFIADLANSRIREVVTGNAVIAVTTTGPTTPTVTAMDAGGTYYGNPFPASATATNARDVSVSGSFAFTYYVGSSVSGEGFATPPTNAGTYTVVAAFTSSDTHYTDAQSAPVTFTITPTTTRTSVSASAGTVTLGESETLTATVTSAVATPNGGTVTFFDGTTTLGTAPLTNGTASLTTSALAVGANVIIATYSGDGLDFAGSSTVLSASSLIQTVAGNGVQGYNGDGIPATAAELTNVYGVVVDARGDLFFVDLQNSRIREVNATTHLISTVAGTGTAGYNGDGIPATSAKLDNAAGIAVDSAGDLFIADTGNNRIREVSAATGLISTVAGNGTEGFGGDGGLATSAELNLPQSVAVDAAGNIFFADYGNQRVREVNAATGLISTVAGTGVAGYNGDGITAISAELNQPFGVAVDASGNVFIADVQNQRVREVHVATGLISTVAGTGSAGYNGDGIPATSAELIAPEGVAVDAAGDVFFTELDNRVREVNASNGLISTVAGTGTDGYNGDGIPATSANVSFPYGVAVDTAGDVFIGDTEANRVREVAIGATITVTAATPSVVAVDAGGTYNGNPFPATATATGVDGITPVSGTFTFTYYVGTTASGNGSATAPTNAGTYTVVAAFASSDPNYANAQSGPDTFTISQATPQVTASDAGGTYNGNPFPASATATGVGGITPVSGSFTFTYYVGSSVNGNGFATAPTNAGTYTVVAAFASSDANYSNAQSGPVTFTIGQATPQVTASDAGGTYNANPFPASATASGVGGVAVSGSFTFAYYAGSTVNGNGSATAPTNAGPYTVVAAFASSNANYSNQQSGPDTFTISQATPQVTASDAGGTYNGNPFPASATATGVRGDSVSGSFTFTYYVGSTVSGNGSSTAPTNAGTYTVVASFAGNPDYSSANAKATFSISQALPVISVSDAGGVFNGSPFPATASIAGVVAGVDNTPGSSLEGTPLVLTYYAGTLPTGTPLSGAPTSAGSYTVEASFAGSTDYLSFGKFYSFVIFQAAAVFTVGDSGGTFNGSPCPGTGTVAGVVPGVDNTPGGSLENVNLTFLYYAGTNISGTPLAGAPSTAGSYTVEAYFPGSEDYSPGGKGYSFVISQAAPVLTVSDPGGTYNDTPFSATATVAGVVAGVDNTPGNSLENVNLTIAYYAGNNINGTPLSGPPVDAGTYTVLASFPGSTDYRSTSDAHVFSIASAQPTITVTDAGGPDTGQPYPASANATGIGGASVSGSFAFTYYVGSTVSGQGTSTAPTNPGTYTVTAAFTSGNGDYANASGGPVTFVISQPAPTITAPAAASLNENSSLTFSTANANAISLTDNAASGTSDSLSLSVAHGALKFGSTSGLKFTSGSNNSASLTATGTLANLNAALQTLKYTPASGYFGPDTISLTVSDSGTKLTGSAAVNLTVNGPPTIGAPATAGVNENATLVFSSTNGKAITIADAAAAGTSDSLTLTVTNGTLTLGSTAGLTFSSGSNNSASMTVSGTLANLNAALSGLTYLPKTGYSGSASLTLKVKDSGSSLSASATVAITVSIPASQPTVTVGTPIATSVPGEPVPLVFTVTDTNSAAQAANFSLAISFGDGKSATVSAGSALIVNHVYTKSGTYTVSVTATDEFGHASSTATTTVHVVTAALEADPFDPSQTALFVGGTTSKDTVSFTLSGNQIAVTLNKVAEGTFSTSGPLIVFGQGGADVVNVGPGITNASYLLESPTADNVETDLDNEAIQWAGLTSAVEILNK